MSSVSVETDSVVTQEFADEDTEALSSTPTQITYATAVHQTRANQDGPTSGTKKKTVKWTVNSALSTGLIDSLKNILYFVESMKGVEASKTDHKNSIGSSLNERVMKDHITVELLKAMKQDKANGMTVSVALGLEDDNFRGDSVLYQKLSEILM